MKATIIVGLGFGDEGKGSITEHYVRQGAHAVVRFNGGGQAAHNVVLPGGVHHTFSQFGAGTFEPGVRTFLSKHMLVDPLAIMGEADHLIGAGVPDALERLAIDGEATVVTPFHRAVNRIRELKRGSNRHGSCGIGIGETVQDRLNGISIRITDLLLPEDDIAKKLREIQRAKATDTSLYPLAGRPRDEAVILLDEGAPAEFAKRYRQIMAKLMVVPSSYLAALAASGDLVFEGAQGALIDEWWGFHPHTTWSTTTYQNAMDLLYEINYQGTFQKIGVTRAYSTRHGPGPFPTEDSMLGEETLKDIHNSTGQWQREFRVGWLDLPLLDYAIRVNGGLDGLAITCLDRLAETSATTKICTSYDNMNEEFYRYGKIQLGISRDLTWREKLGEAIRAAFPRYEKIGVPAICSYVAAAVKTPIKVVSCGPTWREKTSC